MKLNPIKKYLHDFGMTVLLTNIIGLLKDTDDYEGKLKSDLKIALENYNNRYSEEQYEV